MKTEPVQQVAGTKMFLKEEWHTRHVVMQASLDVLSDGQPYTSRQILDVLNKRGFSIPKRLINSVLFSEARRYVSYDRKTFTYRLREVEQAELDAAVRSFRGQSVPSETKHEVKARYIGRNDEYIFTASSNTGPAFFDTSAKSRTIQVRLNQDHPLFASLGPLLEPINGASCEEIRQRLQQARQMVELLLAAWAKYENDLPRGPRKFRAEEARLEWGRNARMLLIDELDEEPSEG